MKSIDIPVAGIGPGSQPDDGDQFEFTDMPRGMFRHDLVSLPEPEDIANLPAACRLLLDLKAAIDGYRCGDPAIRLDMNGLGAQERDLLAQILGEGEVSITVEQDGHRIQIQESVLTGVWRVQAIDTNDRLLDDALEIADISAAVRSACMADDRHLDTSFDGLPEGVQNAPALLVEISDQLTSHQPDDPAHVINLTLLPLTSEDLILLGERLGVGPVTILSRGYSNCRIGSTAFPGLWWIKYYNSQDALILNTIEIVDIPSVALAAPEDIEASAERVNEIAELYA